MAKIASAVIDLRAEGFGTTHRSLQQLQTSLQRVGRVATIAMGALTAGLGFAVRQASIAEETISKFEAVFKDQADAAREFAETLAKSIGRSKFDLLGFLATLQDTFVPLGFARDQARQLSQQLTQLAVDLASFNNAAEPEVVQLLTSALVGNHEAVRRFGIIITQATLEQELMNQGITRNIREVTNQEKVLARLAIIMRSTTDAQGDAARTAGSFANQFRAFQAVARDVQVELGSAFIPTLTRALAKIGVVLRTTADWIRANKNLTVGLTKIGFSVGSILIILPRLVSAIMAIVSALKAMDVAMLKVNITSKALRRTIIGLALLAVAAVIDQFVRAKIIFSDFDVVLSEMNTSVKSLRNAQIELGRAFQLGDIEAQQMSYRKMIGDLERLSIAFRAAKLDTTGTKENIADRLRRIAEFQMSEAGRMLRSAEFRDILGIQIVSPFNEKIIPAIELAIKRLRSRLKGSLPGVGDVIGVPQLEGAFQARITGPTEMFRQIQEAAASRGKDQTQILREIRDNTKDTADTVQDIEQQNRDPRQRVGVAGR
jgi:hypothetical protein